MRLPVGESLARIDGVDKVTGKALYAYDVTLPGMLHARVLRSPFPHARIRRIDSGRAGSLPGVRAVITQDCLPVVSPYIGGLIKDLPIVALEKVRYAGDIVAAVAANDEGIAEEALGRIDVDYEELPAVFSVEEAVEKKAHLVHEVIRRTREPEYGKGAVYVRHADGNLCHHFRLERGEIQKGFEESHFIFEETFDFPAAHHCPMEPHASVASFEGDSLTIWASSQGPFRAVRTRPTSSVYPSTVFGSSSPMSEVDTVVSRLSLLA